MGLTIAEVFVLLVFILLLLFLLWRWDYTKIREALGDTVDPASPQFEIQLANLRATIDFAASNTTTRVDKESTSTADFTTLQSWISELAPEQQSDLAAQVESMDTFEWILLVADWREILVEPHFRELIDMFEELQPQVRERLLSAAQDGMLTETAGSLKEVDRLRDLLPTDQDEQVAKSVADLSPEQKRKLVDLVQSKGLPSIIEESDRLEKAIRDSSEISRKLNDWKETRDQIVGRLNDRLGDMVEKFGGRMDLPHGRIALPNDRLGFAQGTAIIKAQFAADLGKICREFIETLYESRDRIQEIRIEGHASSEWYGATEPIAYRNNLDLSQRRAHAVLDFCLDRTPEPEIRRWARSRIVAIGYSSSRPVQTSGSEDRDASRRVEFGYLMNDNEALEEMRSVDSEGRNQNGRIQIPIGVLKTEPQN